MDERTARGILGKWLESPEGPLNGQTASLWGRATLRTVQNPVDGHAGLAHLQGHFTVEELEAVIWWMSRTT